MRINRVKLYNISSYSGTWEMDFTVSGTRNIVLIGGQNGTGKTSLFTAIKLALYGPLCFQFQSKNNQYTARIKEFINHDAFAHSEVSAYIELEIEIPRDQTMVRYTIRREWTYAEKKLTEMDDFWEDGRRLNEKEVDFFQSYLYHVIPPNLFDFFFFDGEEIANFFSTPGYHSFLKEAVLTLDHYDTFRLIEKYCRRYTVSEDDSEAARKQREEYDAICDELDQADDVRRTRALRIEELQKKADECEQERTGLEESFKKSGGLRQGERESLQKQADALERRRDQLNTQLKGFVEENNPLILTMPVAKALRAQLSLEDQMRQYHTIARQVSPDRLETLLAGLLPAFGVERTEEFIQALSKVLDDSVKPPMDTEHFRFIHDLSQEQREAVGEVLSRLDRFDRDEIAGQIREKEDIGQELAKIRKILDSSRSPEEVAAYENRMAELETEQEQYAQELETEQKLEAEYEIHLEKLEIRRKSLRSALISSTRKIEAGEYTERLSDMMHAMLSELLDDKCRQIESETLRLSKEILRKEHFIDLVELDENFHFSLYRREEYTFEELSSLFANLGADDLSRRIGKQGVQMLQEYFQASSITGLKKLFKRQKNQATLFDDKRFDLYKRIEFSQLSKGEKQIFILSLYWAIIKTSGCDIPFVIDTPFARIDAEHREQITKKFFLDISGQVIILSTDEEITSTYYSILAPYLAQEYTLSYNEESGGTQVSPGYSFGGERA